MPPGLAVGGAAVAGGILGGIAGAQGQRSNSTSNSTFDNSYSSNVNAGIATDAENLGQNGLLNNYQSLSGLVNAGPGASDVQSSLDASHSLASMLQAYSQSGGLPSNQDITNANGIASNMFQPQQVALNQSFITQNQQAAQQAALMGRSIDDPVLQAKFRISQIQQQQQLSAQQGAFGQNLALQLPGQRIGYAQNQASVLQGLASQAMANRQALASMGEGIMNNERNFRLATASRYGNQNGNSNGSQQSQVGGGLGGAITGAMGGIGTGMSLGSSFMGAGGAGMFGGGGGGGLTMPQMNAYQPTSGPNLGNYRF